MLSLFCFFLIELITVFPLFCGVSLIISIYFKINLYFFLVMLNIINTFAKVEMLKMLI